MCAKNEFSADLLQELSSRISTGSPIYCKPLVKQKNSNYSFPQAPGFCCDGIFILPMYFDANNIHLTDKISLHRTYWLVFIGGDIDYFLPSIISVSKYTAKIQIGILHRQGR